MRCVKCLALATLCLASCVQPAMDRQMAGTFNGAMLGGMLGSAVGDLAGGYHGAALGNVIGMVAGGALGHAATAPHSKSKRPKVQPPKVVIDWETRPDTPQNYPIPHARTTQPRIAIEDVAIYEAVSDGILAPEERAEVEFVLHNTTDYTLTNVEPMVCATPDKYLLISPPQPIAELRAGSKVRYTAFVFAKRGVKAKPITFSVRVDHRGRIVDEKRFTLQGRKPMR